MQREGFVFYQSFRNATKHLPKPNQEHALVMIVAYGIDWVVPEPDLDPIAYAMFCMARPQIDANNQRFLNWKWGWRPKVENQTITEQEPKYNQDITEVKAKEKEKEKEKVKEKEKSPPPSVGVEELPESVQLLVPEFLKMRKAMWKKFLPTTQRVKKLKELWWDEQGMIAVLEQSIANNWQGIFELKNKPVVPKNDQERLAEFDRLGRERFKVVYPFELYQEVKQKYKAQKKQQLLDSMNNHAKETPQVI